MESFAADWMRENHARWVAASGLAHKNSRGRVLVCGGPLAKGGAVKLAAEAALRHGAGYCTVVQNFRMLDAVSRIRDAEKSRIRDIVSRIRGTVNNAGEWVIADFPKTTEWSPVLAGEDALVFGCGLPAAGKLTPAVARSWKPFFNALIKEAKNPKRLRTLVVDGGGLALFLREVKRWPSTKLPVIFTPHPKEAADMLKVLGVRKVPEKRVDLLELLRGHLVDRGFGGALLLKGAYPCASSLCVDTTTFSVWDIADARLATAGSGDTLAGAVAALSLRVQAEDETRSPFVALGLGVALQADALPRVKGAFPLAHEIGIAMGEALADMTGTKLKSSS